MSKALDWQGQDRSLTVREQLAICRTIDTDNASLRGRIEAMVQLLSSLSAAPLSEEEIFGWSTDEWEVAIARFNLHLGRINHCAYLVERHGVQ